jgi:hypothetical protein
VQALPTSFGLDGLLVQPRRSRLVIQIKRMVMPPCAVNTPRVRFARRR